MIHKNIKKIQYIFTMDNVRLIIKDYHKDNLGIGNVLKNLISAIGIHDDVVIECYDDYTYGNYDTILDDTFIYRGQVDKQLERAETCRLLVHRSEESVQNDIPNEEWYMAALNNPRFHHYFSFSRRIDLNYDTNKVHTIVKERIFKDIDKIIFKPIVTGIVQIAHDTFKQDTTLGISIRTWTCKHETNIPRAYDSSVYFDKINDVLQRHPSITKIVLSVDNPTEMDKYVEYFKQKHIACFILNKNDGINDIQYAIIKALILAKCNYFIGNRRSTFSELVFWFSKHQTNVYTVY